MTSDVSTDLVVAEAQSIDDDILLLSCLRQLQTIVVELDRSRRSPEQVSQVAIDRSIAMLSETMDKWALRLERRIDNFVRAKL